jgi:hypothetical protein
MIRHRESKSSTPERAAKASILDRCDDEIYSDDNGALLGQLSMLRAGMFVEGHDDLEWHEAVSRAVSAH